MLAAYFCYFLFLLIKSGVPILYCNCALIKVDSLAACNSLRVVGAVLVLYLRIPKSLIQQQQQKRQGKKICCPNFFCSHKYHKLKNILFLQKKVCQFTKIIVWYRVLFIQKIATKLSKIWVWDPGPVIRDSEWIRGKPTPDPGSRG